MHKRRRWILAGLASLLAISLALGVGGGTSIAAPAGVPLPIAGDAPVIKITAFLNQHCVACHNEKKHKGDLTLSIYTSQQEILKGRKNFLNALKMLHAGEMPPEDKPKPAQADIEAFFAAVNGLYAEADKNAKPDPGRITVRRLNRTEYNNTVHDLLGIDVTPAEDFPADDIGNGFDNIGDVLTVSPILMERYLAAAENVSAFAVALEPPKPVGRWQGAKYLEPAGPKVPDVKFRPLAKGAVNTPYRLDLDGDYVFRTTVYGEKSDDENVRATLLVDGKEVETIEVKGTSPKENQTIRHPMKMVAGQHRFAVQIANPSEGATEFNPSEKKSDKKSKKQSDAKPDDKGGEKASAATQPAATQPAATQPTVRKLFVEYIAVEGPSDTRPASQQRLLSYAEAKAPHADQIRQILTKFVSRAYRRPATSDEVERLAKLVEGAEAGGEKFEGGLRLAIQAVLVSPKFLFRLELDDRPTAPEARPVDDYALANRLSYFIWASMPDEELFDLAAKKQLAANLEPQVRRMLKDPRAQSLVDNFAMQWLQLKRLRSLAPDHKLFPSFDEQLRNSMATETEMFIGSIIKEDRSILDLIDANYTFLDERLAKLYGIGDTNGNPLYQKPVRAQGDKIPYEGWFRVSLLPNSPRGGLLTQASILTVTSNPTRTSPVKRGKWVLEQILGTPPPAPPPNVPELDKDGKANTVASLRKRMEIHRENPACANCHAKMDPIGFAFENFNAVGGFRQKDGDVEIDSTGILPDGKTFKGPAELKTILKDKKDLFAHALTEKLMTYGLGRGLEYYDDRSVDKISQAVAADDYKFSRMVVEIAKSDPFLMRRGLGKE